MHRIARVSTPPRSPSPFHAKPIIVRNVTVSGVGTCGLAQRRQQQQGTNTDSADPNSGAAAQPPRTSELAFQEWKERKEKDATLRPPPPRCRSPRERYDALKAEHQSAALQYQAKRQAAIAEVKKEAKERRAMYAAARQQTEHGLREGLAEDKLRRMARLEQYSTERLREAREREALDQRIELVWHEVAEEEERARANEIAQRRQLRDKQSQEAMEEAVKRTKHRQQQSNAFRAVKTAILERSEALQKEELAQRQAEVALLKRSLAGALQQSRELHEEHIRRTVGKAHQPTPSPTAHDRQRTRKHSATLSDDTVQGERRRLQGMQRCTNAVEEALLHRQQHADSVRQWKQEQNLKRSM